MSVASPWQHHVAVIQALPEPSLLVGEDGTICAANLQAQRLLSPSHQPSETTSLAHLVKDSPDKVLRYLRACAAGRQPIPGTLTLSHSDNGPTAWRCDGAVVQPRTAESPAVVLLRLRPKQSAVDKFVVLNRTIDSLNAEIRERHVAEERLRLLAELSTTLATSREYHELLHKFARLLVGKLGDWATILLAEDSGELTHAVTAHIDDAKQELLQSMCNNLAVHTPPRELTQIVQDGKSLYFPYLSQEQMAQMLQNPETLAAIHKVGPCSGIAVPLHARGRALGVLAVAWTENERHYTQSDLEFIEELARRAALSVENARLYQEARDFSYTLERLVEERTSELEHTNQELDQFAYVASHDLKAPLRAIKHLADWIAEDSADALPQVARDHLARLHQRIARMERLLDDLLAFSRAGRQSHALEEVNTRSLVENIVDLVNIPPGFTISVDPALPVLYTERVPLETIFRNLIQNAVKHHHDPAHGHVTITARPIDPGTEFSVSDNGPGIDPQFHSRIFDIFQALRPRDEIEGSGIGLSVVKKLVERRGGVIQVESAPDQGATFRFTWPAAASRHSA